MNYADLEILRTLKEDIFGTIVHARFAGQEVIVRNYFKARNLPARWLAYVLARREARILVHLSSLHPEQVPHLIHFGNGICVRSYIDGDSLRNHPVTDKEFYEKGLALLEQMHSLGVAHNDLEKPENWLVTRKNTPAIIDFQLAFHSRRMGYIFRLAKREDFRHLIKNKKRFCTEALTEEEKAVLQGKSRIAVFIKKYFKPVYHFITRKVLGYSDREHSKYSR